MLTDFINVLFIFSHIFFLDNTLSSTTVIKLIIIKKHILKVFKLRVWWEYPPVSTTRTTILCCLQQ